MDINFKNRVKLLAIGGLLCAMDIVCTRFLSFYTPGAVDRISLQFLPNALAGAVLGPIWGMIICALGDTVGMVINSGGFTFTPLITLACVSRGLIYGLILHNRTVSLSRCAVSVTLVTFIVELGMMPLFLSILYGRGWLVVLLGKLPVRILTIPAYSFVLYTVSRALTRAGITGVIPGRRQI